MRIGKVRKRAKMDRNSINIFGVVRKYLIGEEMGKKVVIKVQNPYLISINRLIRKYILSFHPQVPEKQMCQNCMPTMNINTLCCMLFFCVLSLFCPCYIHMLRNLDKAFPRGEEVQVLDQANFVGVQLY